MGEISTGERQAIPLVSKPTNCGKRLRAERHSTALTDVDHECHFVLDFRNDPISSDTRSPSTFCSIMSQPNPRQCSFSTRPEEVVVYALFNERCLDTHFIRTPNRLAASYRLAVFYQELEMTLCLIYSLVQQSGC